MFLLEELEILAIAPSSDFCLLSSVMVTVTLRWGSYYYSRSADEQTEV